MSQETFLNYRRFRWLWVTLGIVVVMTALYLVNAPVGGRNGGTPLGYTYGVLATVGILWLMAFGLRKRAYHSSLGTLQGWLAAHVWIGIGLLLVVPLHAGFSFGVNIHTAAYVFMVVTIISGIWGAANYEALSGKIVAHRGGLKDSATIEQINELSAKAEKLCAGKGDAFLKLFNTFNVHFSPSLRTLLFKKYTPSVEQHVAVEMLGDVTDSEHGDAVALLGILDQRLDMMRSLVEQARIKALLRFWLFVHVPSSFALCVALFVHIFSVFFLW